MIKTLQDYVIAKATYRGMGQDPISKIDDILAQFLSPRINNNITTQILQIKRNSAELRQELSTILGKDIVRNLNSKLNSFASQLDGVQQTLNYYRKNLGSIFEMLATDNTFKKMQSIFDKLQDTKRNANGHYFGYIYFEPIYEKIMEYCVDKNVKFNKFKLKGLYERVEALNARLDMMGGKLEFQLTEIVNCSPQKNLLQKTDVEEPIKDDDKKTRDVENKGVESNKGFLNKLKKLFS